MKTIVVSGVSILIGVGIGWYAVRSFQSRTPAETQPQEPAVLAQPAAATGLSQADKAKLERLRQSETDLLRLRSEVTQLRQEAESYRHRHAQQAVSPANGLAHAPAIGRFMSKEQLVNAGFSTPDAALQSFMAAVASGNSQQLLAVMDPQQATNAPAENLAALQQNVERLAARFKGVQMIAKKVLSDDKVDIEVLLFEEGKPPYISIQHMVKSAGEWKFSGASGANIGWGQDGRIEVLTP
jgi:hypothetical protein